MCWPELFAQLYKETGYSDIGWRISQSDPLKYYPAAFNRFSAAPTLLEGLRHICRANRVFSNNQRIWLRFTRDYAYACHYDLDRGPGYGERATFRAGIGMNVIRSFLGPFWCPKLILTETPLDAMPNRGTLAGARIMRWRGYGAIQIPKILLPTSNREPLSTGYASERLPASTLPDQIQQTLRSYVHSGVPTPQAVAEMMHVSERTLQRRLGEQGTSYLALLNTARINVATELLGDRSLRIVDIANSLGFDDQSHFTRFFRRVSGVTPTTYRQCLDNGTITLAGSVH